MKRSDRYLEWLRRYSGEKVKKITIFAVFGQGWGFSNPICTICPILCWIILYTIGIVRELSFIWYQLLVCHLMCWGCNIGKCWKKWMTKSEFSNSSQNKNALFSWKCVSKGMKMFINYSSTFQFWPHVKIQIEWDRRVMFLQPPKFAYALIWEFCECTSKYM